MMQIPEGALGGARTSSITKPSDQTVLFKLPISSILNICLPSIPFRDLHLKQAYTKNKGNGNLPTSGLNRLENPKGLGDMVR